MTMFGGRRGPSRASGRREAPRVVPYAQVDDVDAAAKRAVTLGAQVLQPKTRGPAGSSSWCATRRRRPALWQKA